MKCFQGRGIYNIKFVRSHKNCLESTTFHLSGFGDFASFQSANVPPPVAPQQQQQASLLMGGPTLQPQQTVQQQQPQQPAFADFGSFQASGATTAQVRVCDCLFIVRNWRYSVDKLDDNMLCIWAKLA